MPQRGNVSLTKLGLPAKVTVLNNGTLGSPDGDEAGGFFRPAVDLESANFAAMVKAVGVDGVRVENPET